MREVSLLASNARIVDIVTRGGGPASDQKSRRRALEWEIWYSDVIEDFEKKKSNYNVIPF